MHLQSILHLNLKRQYFAEIAKAVRLSIVSDRALISALPTLSSFAQDGISPHRISFTAGPPPAAPKSDEGGWKITGAICVGAIL